MAIDSLGDQINSALDPLKTADFGSLLVSGGSAQQWQSMTSDEVSRFVSEVFKTLFEISQKDLLRTLSYQQLNQILSTLNNFNTQFNSVRNIPTAQISTQHHTPLSQLQSLDAIVRQSGLFSIVKLDPDMELSLIHI